MKVSVCTSSYTATRPRSHHRWPDGPPPRHLRDEAPSATSQEATRQVTPSPQGHSRSNRPERWTALVTRKLARNKMDVAALSETRFSVQGQQEQVVAGYTFFWSGRPRAERRDVGVAFTIQNDIVRRLPCLPQAINGHLMSLRPPLRGGK
ncbi:hypothetical protein SprV_0301194700 [Sparganum proliferum]